MSYCLCNVSDRSVPELNATMTDYQTEINHLSSLVTSQAEFERTSHENHGKNAQHALPCKQPRCDADLFSKKVNCFEVCQVAHIACLVTQVNNVIYVCFIFYDTESM